MKKVILLTSVFSALILTSTAVMAERGERGPRRGMTGHDEMFHHGKRGMPPEERCFHDRDYMKDKLGLNEKQIQDIESLNGEYREQISALTSKIRPLQRELRGILLAEELNLDAAKAILKKISLLEVELRFLRIKHRNDIEKTLTPEQKKKFRNEKRRMRD